MADNVARLGLFIDASGALQAVKEVQTATKAMGTTATQSAQTVTRASEQVEQAYREQAAAAEQAALATRVLVAAQTAEKAQAAELARTQSALAAARKDVAAGLARETTMRNTLEMATRQLAAAEAAAAATTTTATTAIAASTVATTAAAGATTLLGRALALVGGPLGVVMLALQGAQLAWSAFTERQKKAADEAKQAARDFDRLADAAKNAILSTAVATAEAKRAAAEQRLVSAGARGDQPGALAAFGDMQRAAVDVEKATQALAKFRRETEQARGSLVGAFANELANARDELDAFRKGGEQGAEAYRLAAREWTKAGNDARTLAAALRENDPTAKALIATTTQLVKAQRTLNDEMNPKSVELTDKAWRAHLRTIVTAEQAAKATAKSVDGLEAINERIAKGLRVNVAEEARLAEVKARASAKAKAAVDQAEEEIAMLGRTREEQARLADMFSYLKLRQEGFTEAQANAVLAGEKAKRSYEEQADALERLGRQLDEIAEKRERAAEQRARQQGLSAGGAGLRGDLGGLAATFGPEVSFAFDAVRSIADAFDLFGTKAREAAEAQRRYNEALDAFRITETTALDAALRDNLARANALIPGAIGAAGLSGNGAAVRSAAELKQIIDILAAGPARVRPLAAELQRLYDELTRNEEALRKQNEADRAALREDLTVRELRVRGLDDEAERMALAIQQQREAKEVSDKFRDAALDARLATLQAAEAEALLTEQRERAAQKAEEARRSTFDFTNGALAFTDPALASELAFLEEQNRRILDAIARGAGEAELAAIRLYNAAAAAAREAEKAENIMRTREGLIGRGLTALGDPRAATFIFDAQQRQEFTDAVRAGMQPAELAMLQFVQFAEREMFLAEQRIAEQTKAINKAADDDIAAAQVLIDTIEKVSREEIARIDAQIAATRKAADAQIEAIRAETKARTDAIDAQIEGARAQLEASRETISALEQQTRVAAQVYESLQQFLDQSKLGDLSPLSPGDKLAEARSQFDRQLALAQGGDASAAAGLPSFANAFLQASRGFNASNPAFAADFARTQSALSGVQAQFGAGLPGAQASLEAARRSADAAEAQIEALQKQRESIQDAANRQIDTIRSQADRTIDALNDTKSAVEQASRDNIKKLQDHQDERNQQRIDDIAAVREREIDLANTRIRENEYYTRWNQVNGFGDEAERLPGGGPRMNREGAPSEQTEVITEMRDEIRTLRATITTLLTQSNDTARAGLALSTALTDEVVNAENRTTSAVQTVARETRGVREAVSASRTTGRTVR